MAKGAVAGFQKVVRKCPKCKTDGAKELVEGRRKRTWYTFWLLKKSNLEALCPNCGHTFNPK